ncbi:MAG: type II toxin-antitoxin system RelE/ParE family toxin [SAR324 cluster bacterium]|nr:type II toxin-antitoxin system RelE/ParE family toxin [SAR324 cluster bacterium]
MGWKIKIGTVAEKQIRKMDRSTQKRILDFLSERIEDCKNPRHFGEPLKGDKSGYWRYRIGDYRVLCEIFDEKLIVLVIAVGHRREVYKKS